MNKDKTLPLSYRSVCLLSNISKVFEYLITHWASSDHRNYENGDKNRTSAPYSYPFQASIIVETKREAG